MTPVLGGGLLLVDKPAGCTSHDVVGRVRWLLRTKRVGHAGTLDPMATGLLVLGLERSTKLLGRLILATKSYEATIRLGGATTTDDAEGAALAPFPRAAGGVTVEEVEAGLAALTGDIRQRPSSVSAIKVDGVRAYQRARAGTPLELDARPVRVSRLARTGPLRPAGNFVDVEVEVDCSTGTYVRALARDLGAALGVGAHLTRLRRTAVGPFTVSEAVQVYPDGPPPRARRDEADRTAGKPGAEPGARPAADRPAGLVDEVQRAVLPAAAAARRVFPVREAEPADEVALSFGRPIPAIGMPGTVAVLAGDRLLGLVEEAGPLARPILVFAAAG